MTRECELRFCCDGDVAVSRVVFELSEEAVRLGAPEEIEFRVCAACKEKLAGF